MHQVLKVFIFFPKIHRQLLIVFDDDDDGDQITFWLITVIPNPLNSKIALWPQG